MIDPDTATLGGLFLAGLATSLHCAGMCGLLTCGLGVAGNGPALALTGIYHVSRLIGYALVGGILGAIGGSLGLEFSFAGIPWLPALLILFLIAITLGLDKRFGTIPGLGKLSLAIRMRTLRFPPPARAAIIGLATPFLPCGPLYAMFALALAGGSTVGGIETMLAFGIGAIPALWAVQISSSWVNRKLGAKGFLIAQKTLAGVAAISLMWHFSWIGAEASPDRETPTTCRCSES